MGRSGRTTLKGKILFCTLFCFMAIGIPSLFILFSYMNEIVYEQVDRINTQWIDAEVEKIDSVFSELVTAVAWASQDSTVKAALESSYPQTKETKQKVLAAQSRLSTYLSASPLWEYVNKMVVFNGNGVFFEYAKSRYGNLADVQLIEERKEFRELKLAGGAIVKILFSTTLNAPYEDAVVAYGRVVGVPDGWIYAELDTSMFDSLITDSLGGKTFIVSDSWVLPEMIEDSFYGASFTSNDIPFSIDGICARMFVERKQFSLASSYGLTMFLIIMVAASFLFIFLASLFTRMVTRPTDRLVRHIRYLTVTNNYGTVDESIEKGSDEISRIGHTVNAMSLSISNLLKRNEKLFEEKKNTELLMLQMQVNPHFLYNTLESIHYLAEVQKADGIAAMSRGLSNLLKNMAKGTQDHIMLKEELALLHDYDLIQQVRYMGIYEIVDNIPEDLKCYRIQKFTLQPLVENAIFHGIEPKGGEGTITLDAYRDEKHLYITVTDDGVGISKEKMDHIFDEVSHFKGNMTGVGVKNINERLKLGYGEDCGLSYSSPESGGTVATVKLLLEL